MALLLAKGADPNIENFMDGTPLHRAAMNGHADIITVLLEHGADVNAHGKIAGAQTPLDLAALEGRAEAAKVLLDAGACMECESSTSNTPLAGAAARGRDAVVVLLLARGAQVDHRTMGNVTALHLAVERGHLGTARLLLEAGADPRIISTQGPPLATLEGTPLQIARRVGNEEIATLLREHGATE